MSNYEWRETSEWKTKGPAILSSRTLGGWEFLVGCWVFNPNELRKCSETRS